jgi:hypothetical protein
VRRGGQRGAQEERTRNGETARRRASRFRHHRGNRETGGQPWRRSRHAWGPGSGPC